MDGPTKLQQDAYLHGDDITDIGKPEEEQGVELNESLEYAEYLEDEWN